MHSYDRTLLAKLAFADHDKANPRHDWACQYLAQKDVLESLVASVTGKEGGKLRDAKPEDVATLKASGIRHRRLSPKFDEYVKARENQKSMGQQGLEKNAEI